MTSGTTARRIRGTSVLASILLAVSVHAAPAKRTAFFATGGATLRWDNIEGPPLWVDGAVPRWSPPDGRHLVRLEPGMSVTLELARGAILRVHRSGRRIEPRDAAAWISDGSGLEAMIEPLRSDDTASLLFYPGSLKPMRVRLVRPASAAGPLEAGLFVSRLERESRTAGFRELISLPGPPSAVAREGQIEGEPFWRGCGKPQSAPVRGPAALALETRLRYPREETAQLQDYAVRVSVAGIPRELRFEAVPDASVSFSVDGEPAVLATERTVIFEVPEGVHEARVECADFVYARLLRKSAEDFLLADPPRFVESPPALDGETLRLLGDDTLAEMRLLGAMRARQIATGPGVHPDDRSLAAAFFRRHTHYRSLLPAEKDARGPLSAVAFASPRLLDPGEPREQIRVAAQHLGSALDGLSTGWFVEAPSSREAAHVYELPERASPSLLRLAVLKRESRASVSASFEWFAQLDDDRPLALRLSGGQDFPPAELQSSVAEAARTALGGLTTPVPVARAAVAELPLAPGTRRVRVWAGSDGAPPVAVQYLCGSPREVTELEHLEMTRRAAVPGYRGNVLVACYRRWIRGEPPPEPAWAELSSRWTPLFRHVSQATRRYQDGVVRPEPPALAGGLLEELLLPREGVEAARRFAEAGEWLAALEAWSREIQVGDRDTYAVARIERVAALQALGEQFLAERQLRGIFLFEGDPGLRREALDHLIALHRRAGDADSLIGVLAIAAAETADPLFLRLLAEALEGAGERGMALDVALSIAGTDRPLDLVSRCALSRGWWRVFEDAVASLEDAGKREYWRGVSVARRGDPAGALAHLEAGGAEGRSMAASLRWALSAPRPEDDPIAWAGWQASFPGPREWRDDPSLVIDAAGGTLAYNPARDLFQSFHRASPGKPIKVRVVGPARLKVEARPLHPAGVERPADGWLLLREGSWLYPVAINGNSPSRSLVLAGVDPRLAGTRVTEEVPIGSGLHVIEVEAPGMDVLAKFEIERPALLPFSLSPRAPPDGKLAAEEAGEEDSPRAGGGLPDVCRSPVASDDVGLRRRMTLLVYEAEQDPCLRREAQVAAEEIYRAHPAAPGLQPLYLRLMESTEWKRVASVRSSAGLRAVEVTGWQPASPELRVRKALLPPLEPHERLITGGSAVVLSLSNERPALLHLELATEVLEYLPMSPLTVVCRLDAEEELKLLLSPGAPSSYSWLEAPGSRPRVPLRLSIPPGEHTVRLWIEQPVVNHFVRMSVREVAGGGEAWDFEEGEEVSSARSRVYHVATSEKPLRLGLEGPASLQVDELLGGRTVTRRSSLPEGWHEVVLRPEPGRDAALFRVFQRAEGGGSRAAVPPLPPEGDEAVPERPPSGAGPVEPGRLLLEDAYALGGQEDGTISFEAILTRRRLLDEDGRRREKAEQFLEVAGVHRHFSERLGAYFDSVILARAHEKSGPAIGAEEDVHLRPDWLPFTLRITAAAHAQWPDGPMLLPEGPVEWAGLLRGGMSRRWPIGLKAYHAPSLSVFGRYLSLDDTGRFDSEDLDQDVFTEYKDDHRSGLVASETIGYMPWLDTEWWGRAALTTNRDLNPGDPDHLSAWAGWKQLVNGFELAASYQYTKFFNDSDRGGASDRHSFALKASRDFWCTLRDRFEVGIELRHDFPDDLTSGFIFLAWHFSAGRRYRDFWPGEVDFLDLRNALAPRSYQNAIREERDD